MLQNIYLEIFDDLLQLLVQRGLSLRLKITDNDLDLPNVLNTPLKLLFQSVQAVIT